MLVMLAAFCLKGQEGAFLTMEVRCGDEVKRPAIVYTPVSVSKKARTPLLVYMHGAISNPKLKADPLAYMQRSSLVGLAEEGAFRLMFVYGQKGAGWFDAVGSEMVMDAVEMAKKKFAVDTDRVFLSGFSDGGSGTIYLAMTEPEAFAGFIAMNGHLRVATKIGSCQLYPENMNQKPFLMINTRGDVLYPSRSMGPMADALKAVNPYFTFRDLEGSHSMEYLEAEKARILQFISENQRKTLAEMSWETSDIRSGGLDWLKITGLDTLAAPAKWHMPPKLTLFEDKAVWGMKFDYAFEGPGLKVKGFASDTSTAERIGVIIGDVVMMMEKDSMKNPYSPYFYVAKKKAGDPCAVQ
ncbi:MAG: phospholipase, partial [Bacteroidota bacterium]